MAILEILKTMQANQKDINKRLEALETDLGVDLPPPAPEAAPKPAEAVEAVEEPTPEPEAAAEEPEPEAEPLDGKAALAF